MPKEETIWKCKKAAGLWYKEFSSVSSGIIDEKYVKDYIGSKGKVKVISLGIGTGRELSWLSQLRNIKETIGIDYSQEMLDICQKVAEKTPFKVSLIKDDLLSLEKFRNYIKNEKLTLIYICLINTLGNFEEKDRQKFFKKIYDLMKKKDRLILCLYKRPERIKAKMFLPKQVRLEGDLGLRIKFGELIEYISYKFWWPALLEKYHQLPRFWYNDKTNDIEIYIGRKKIFISHRFSKEEIKKLVKTAKLKIEKLIEGKFMWVVILKVWYF